MTPLSSHLPPWTLDALAEDELPHAEKNLAMEHVRGCAHCAAELESARALFASLAALPSFEPSAKFADAVMARVAVRPAEAFAAAPAEARRRWLPRTRAGWMGLTGAVLVPAAPAVAILAWLLSYPGVTLGSVFRLFGDWAAESAWSGAVRTAAWMVGSPAWERAVTMPGGLAGLAAVALVLALSIPVSGWGIVRLLRTPMGGMTHAH
ncbi:MAG TPA: hypothetical protein VHG91_04345 [Longimicrobium sp.]|nr:hypothetical protein [Longimicrobium sp.]